MNIKPRISIIMPVFNTERYVAEAVESVLQQTYQPIELICINDGSKDKSLEILQSFGDKITLIDSQENVGIAEARNKGLRAMTGEYVAFMDADDLWKPEKLSLQIAEFEKNPLLDICFTYSQYFLSPELPEEIKKIRHLPQDPVPGFLAATSLIKTFSFQKIGEFNKKWRVGEFIDWLARANEAKLVQQMIPTVLHLRRIHETNTGVTQRPSRTDYIRILKESLDRKRQS
jgi:glycosyltransferase involved in cell wall biosynthesis